MKLKQILAAQQVFFEEEPDCHQQYHLVVDGYLTEKMGDLVYIYVKAQEK